MLWLDASRKSSLYTNSTLSTPVANSGDPVGGWADLSSNNNHAIQATSSFRGVYAPTGGPSSKPGVTLDGADDVLTTPPVLLANGTIFIVHKLRALAGVTNAGFVKIASTANLAAGGPTDGVIFYAASSPYSLMRIASPSTANWYKTFASITGSAVNDSVQWNWTWGNTQSTVGMRRARVGYSGSNGTTTYGNPTSLPIHLGAGFGAARANICIGEVIAFNSQLSATNVSAVESYLASKWGVS